ncbi:non-histone chromosomal protein 6 [Gigaspora margarita]|uniref:Non-histone chromosomal protein 6 n=1 Tax=Gigaspora margarita TaxID=4874 RepID=A0A8H3X6E5_GIGMA|nr:non-histone chromosomal protein 6 [Gigaspora margarita]
MKGHFKPVIKTSPSAASSDTTTSNKTITNTEGETLPGSTPQNINEDTQTKVSGKQKSSKSVNNASTQKNKKTQKISDVGQVKKAYSPRKKKSNTVDAATSSNVSPVTTKATVTRKRKSKKDQQETVTKSTETLNINADIGETTTTDVVANNNSIQQPSPDSVSSTVLESPIMDNQTQDVVPVKAPRKRKSKVVTATTNDTKKELNNDGESAEQSKPKRVKKAKDPNAPKKPPNAYMQFSKVKRSEIKEANPDASAKELLTLIGETWRKMSDEEKKPYQDMVKVAMIKYEEQMKSYKDLCANSPVDMPTPDTYTPKQSLDTQEIEQGTLDASIISNNANQNLSGIMVCDSSQPDLSQLAVHQALPSGVSFENYASYGQQDDMEALLDMTDVGNSYEFQTNDQSLYNNSDQLLSDIQNNGSTFNFQPTSSNSNNIQLYDNSAYQFPATMLPLAMNIQDNQDTHNPYFYGDQQPSQVVKQDLLLYEPPIQENCETSESGCSQEIHNSPVILKNRDHNSGNLLLCQPFEPSNGNNNIGNIDMEGSGHWFQDDTQFQDPTNYIQQQYNEYQQIPHEISQQKILQDNSRQISRQEYYQKQMSQHHQQQMAQELSQQRALCHQIQKQQMIPSVQQEITQQQELFLVSNEIGQPPPYNEYNDQNVNWNGVRPEVGGAAV